MSKFVGWEEFRDLVVVAEGRRKLIMELSHEKGGHLGWGKVLGHYRKILYVAGHDQGRV